MSLTSTNPRPFLTASAIALSIIIAAWLIAKPWVTIRHAKPIVVKGTAEHNVMADAGSLTSEVITLAKSNSQAYVDAGTQLEAVRQTAERVLQGEFKATELGTSVVEVMEIDQQGRRTNKIDSYRVTRRLRIETADVAGLEQLGRALFDLNANDLRINVIGPQFFVSDLDPIKLALVEKATANGKNRAEIMAKSSGEVLGPLISAKQGVIQITKRNSTETSSWGIYDTETIEKVVKLVVTLEYEIRG